MRSVRGPEGRSRVSWIAGEPAETVGPAARPVGAAGPRVVRRRFRRLGWPLLFVSPFFVLFAIFSLYPIGFSLWLSLREWSLIGPARWVGLANFRALLHDSLFWQSMANAGLVFLIYVPAMTLLALVLAVLLNSRYVRLQGIWRTLIFLPYIMSGTVAATFTFPLLRPVIVFAITLSIIGTFSLFTEPLLLFPVAGGPAHAAQTPVVEIWQTTFAYLRVGYSAAMSWIYFGVIVVIAMTQYFLVSR